MLTHVPQNPHKRERERSNFDRWPMPIMVESDRLRSTRCHNAYGPQWIEMQFCSNVCQKCRMNGYVKRKRRNEWMTEWTSEWMNESAGRPAGACTPREWPPCLHFQCVGFLNKIKDKKRNEKICTTIREKLVFPFSSTCMRLEDTLHYNLK